MQIPHIDELRLNKHLNWTIIPDVLSLRKIFALESIDLIHSHQDNDALTAILSGFGTKLVRTCYDGEPTPLLIRRRFAYHSAARIMTASRRVQAHLLQVFPEKWIEQVDIPVDLAKFRPTPKNEKLQAEFGIDTNEPVAGIVARVQKHRKFPLLLSALEEVVKVIPRFKLLIVGRGTHIDSIARQPVIQKGLEKSVIFTGYRDNDYPDVLNLIDFKVFLHPGSDGACRAVREALACGKPVVGARRGILPELIKDGETGILFDDQPHNLARAMIIMYQEKDYRLKCSRNARKFAEDTLDPDKYVQKVLACYGSIGTGKRNSF
jgi:glycosyltransferase involved in cell wall biosynthesis